MCFYALNFQAIEEKVTISDAGEACKVDTEAKLKISSSDHQAELKASPSKAKLEFKANPPTMNDDSNQVTFVSSVEHKIGKEYTDLKAGFSYGLPKVADNAGLWIEGNAVTNNLTAHTGDISAVIGYQDQYFIGSKSVANLNTQKVTEMHGFLAAKVNESFMFLLSNCYERKIKLGLSTPKIDYFDKLSAESNIELDEKYQMKGSPTSTIAFEHKLNGDSKLKTKLDIAQDIYVNLSFVHKINPNLQITIGDSLNPLGLFKNSGKEVYKLGVALEATL